MRKHKIVKVFQILNNPNPDSSGAQLREPKLALTKPTKIEAYIQFTNQKSAARQKAFEVQNLITKSKIT